MSEPRISVRAPSSSPTKAHMLEQGRPGRQPMRWHVMFKPHSPLNSASILQARGVAKEELLIGAASGGCCRWTISNCCSSWRHGWLVNCLPAPASQGFELTIARLVSGRVIGRFAHGLPPRWPRTRLCACFNLCWLAAIVAAGVEPRSRFGLGVAGIGTAGVALVLGFTGSLA